MIGQVDGWAGGRLGRWTIGQVDDWAGGRLGRWTVWQVDGWAGGRLRKTSSKTFIIGANQGQFSRQTGSTFTARTDSHFTVTQMSFINSF